MDTLTWLTILIAAVAAVRSTWSPCGLSMLATITPLAERGRGHRYRTTARWYLLGGVAGGVTLGAAMYGLALAVHEVSPDRTVVAALAVAGAALAAVSDSGLAGRRLPFHRRQVNERWLDGFRPWVYGCGFGWQIGSGFSTYVTTAAVYLMVVLAALGASPLAALVAGTVFGTIRGAMVFLGRSITTPQALTAFHARFVGAGTPVAALTVAAMAAAAVTAAWTLSPWAAAALAAAGIASARPAWSSLGKEGACALRSSSDRATAGRVTAPSPTARS